MMLSFSAPGVGAQNLPRDLVEAHQGPRLSCCPLESVCCTAGKPTDREQLHFCLVYFFIRSSLWACRKTGKVSPAAVLLEKWGFLQSTSDVM